MKKFLALVLAFALVFSLGVVAFAEPSPIYPDIDMNFTTRKAPAGKGMEYYDAEDNLLGVVPEEEITQVTVDEADKLSPEDKEAFLQAYDDVKNIEDAVVKYFYWLDVPEKYKTEDVAWYKYEFKCTGDDVQVLVNGKPMEVVHVRGAEYYAKLTELGALAILVGLPAAEEQEVEGEKVLELYNADGEVYDAVPWPEVTEVPVDSADALDADVKDAFLAAYEEVKDDENLGQFFWLDVPDTYKTDEFAWAKYEFTAEGEDAAVTVNGNPVEVVNDGDECYAKLTEFGAVAIF